MLSDVKDYADFEADIYVGHFYMQQFSVLNSDFCRGGPSVEQRLCDYQKQKKDTRYLL